MVNYKRSRGGVNLACAAFPVLCGFGAIGVLVRERWVVFLGIAMFLRKKMIYLKKLVPFTNLVPSG